MPILAPEVVTMITYGGTRVDKVGIMLISVINMRPDIIAP